MILDGTGMSHSRFGGGTGGAGGFPPCPLLHHDMFGSSELRTPSEPDQRCGLRAAGTDVATGRAAMAGKEHRTAALAWIGAGALLVALAIGWYLLPISHWLGALRGWILDLGFTGVAIFVADLCRRRCRPRVGSGPDNRHRPRLRLLGSADRARRGDYRCLAGFSDRPLRRSRQGPAAARPPAQDRRDRPGAREDGWKIVALTGGSIRTSNLAIPTPIRLPS